MVKVTGTRQFEEDVDALFSLPLAEFTGARNALAARLKKAGHGDEGNRVKALVKPSISAWGVNQLYWHHREAFDQLISTGQSFRKAQTARKVADIHEALDARREALSHLTDLATTLLRDSGHNPSPETERRITSTLEALSVYSSLPGGPPSGRLTQDVDPPGFDSLASLMSGAGMPKLTLVPPRAPESPKSADAAGTAQRKKASIGETRRLEEARQKRIAAAKVSLQDAKRLLSKARAREQRTVAAQKEANAEAKAAEKQRREAEQRFEKARTASAFASRRAAYAAAEADEAAKALEDAKRTVEKASGELEELVRQSSGT
ncbi:MAG TPA: hypothetical protein VLR92_10070 [Blastocatellia bacterium]|nr:hypothetical protein [Blastocatellia bacterium]